MVLALPASALAQATRTWVSGVGDDANPCSRTAPCKTWAGAITKTTTGGEIDALDPGGFGTLTITKAITINGAGTNASVLASSGFNGFNISVTPGTHVVINDISFQGVGAGLNGILISSGADVRIENSDIEGWTENGIADDSSAQSTVDVVNTTINGNGGDGVLLAPGAGVAGTVTLSNDEISSNAAGIVATAGSAAAATTISSANSSISNNTGAGVSASGSGATDYISQDAITGNGTGLQALTGGQIIEVGTNTVLGNTVNGSPTSTQSSAPPAAATDVVVSCKAKAQKCSGKLVHSRVKLKEHGRRAHATLTRGGKVYAVGTIVFGSGGSSEAILTPRGHLKAGRYRLTLRRNGRVIGERTVVIK